jgi:hypothetical protein
MCQACGAGLDAEQRYCLSCGSRAGSPSPQLLELKRRAVAGSGGSAAPPAEPPELFTAAPIGLPPSGSGLRLPTPRVAALLVLIFVGFGAMLGSAAGSGSGRLVADISPRLKLVVPSSGASPDVATNASEGSEPPASEAAPTPESASESASPSPAKSAETGKETQAGEQQESGAGTGAGESSATKPATKLPAIRHVFVIMLSSEPYAALFGPESKARYLAGSLEKKGELLVRYDAVAHEQLANEIALVSGQGPTVQTTANCPNYTALSPGGPGSDGQALGDGCVYPAATSTLGGQLAGKHLRWRAYVEGIDEPGTAAGACAHPTLGSADATLATGAYATFRDPFVYFESVTSSPACAIDVVGLSALQGDLANPSRTPSLSYIVPDGCHDAAPTPCGVGAIAGPAAADGFLESVVPRITSSKAYRDGGLLVITTDEAPSTGEFADSSSCCGQPSYPNVTSPAGGLGRGGGAVGALLLSPFVKGASTSQEPYNHFSLLRTIEDIFKLKHLGYAGLSAVKALSPALFQAKG